MTKIVFQDLLSHNTGQKYCRILQGEFSAILLTFIKLPFVIKIFVLSIFEWPFYTGFTVSKHLISKIWAIWLEILILLKTKMQASLCNNVLYISEYSHTFQPLTYSDAQTTTSCTNCIRIHSLTRLSPFPALLPPCHIPIFGFHRAHDIEIISLGH